MRALLPMKGKMKMSGYKNKEEIEKILESVDITGEAPIEEP